LPFLTRCVIGSNIANLVPPFERQGAYHGTSAALEYAVCALKVEHIIIIGHQNCGGIKALMSRTDTACKNDFIDRWMEIASQACERTRLDAGHLPFPAQCSYCERESVNVSLANLLTFPWIKDAVARRVLQLHGWCVSSACMECFAANQLSHLPIAFATQVL
jgi:carbonic anhydrase